MSARELRALGRKGKSKDDSETTRRLTCSSARSGMGNESRVAELEAALEEAERKFIAQTNELEKVTEDYQLIQQRLKDTETEIENHKLRTEVERLKAVEKVRDEEQERSMLWADDLRQRFRMEKQVLEDKVATLEARLASATPASGTGSSATATSSSSSVSTNASTTVTSSPAMTASAVTSSSSSSTATPSTAVTSTSASTVATSSGSGTSTTDSTTTIMSVGSAEMISSCLRLKA